MVRLGAILTFLLAFNSIFGQHSFEQNIDFSQYLLKSKNYTDAIILLESVNSKKRYSSTQQDSLNHYLGKAYYLNQQLDLSSEKFSQVSSNSPLYIESSYFGALSLAYLRSTGSARNMLNKIPETDSLYIQLTNFELAGLSLLERDLDDFEMHADAFNNQYYHFVSQQENFLVIHKELSDFKKRTPVVAGMLSAIIPGAGKIYAGKTGEGITTFLKMALLGLPMIETLDKKGSDDPRFIVFASLFSIAHISNIWGSTISVNVRRKEFNDKIDEQILVNMHIPLRSIFD